MLGKAIHVLAALLALAAAYLLLDFVWSFGQTRYFTIDEYQYGHATWLVTQGQLPYRDFYEHHFPLGYVLNALLLPGEGSFSERALALRAISFGYVLGGSLLVGLASALTTRNWVSAGMSIALPLACGFTLLSVVDYRADVWAAFTFLACLSLIEINRRARSRLLAALAGVLCAMAVLMTQKMVFLAGLTVAILLAPPLLARLGVSRRRSPVATAEIVAAPWAFVVAALSVGVAALVVAAVLGELPRMFELTVLQALEHERIYDPGDTVTFGNYFAPFWAKTRNTTPILIVGAALYAGLGRERFWLVPLGVAALGAALISAPYPYNFVYPGFVAVLCAVRGFGALFDRLPLWRLAPLRPALLLAPLVLIPSQTHFVRGTSTNQHQLALLEKVAFLSEPDDVVIDAAGSALFRPHLGYYWYYGRAETQIYADYFEGRFLDDARASRAPLWIYTGRIMLLPQTVQDYVNSHYITLDADLMGLGFRLPAAREDAGIEVEIEVIRAGRYTIVAPEGNRSHDDLTIDGEPVRTPTVPLTEGRRVVSIRPGSPPYTVSLFPAEASGRPSGSSTHAPLFEYRPERRPTRPRR